MTGLNSGEDDVEILHRLLGKFDAIDDEQHALSVPGLEEAADQRGTEERLSCPRRHFEQELPAPVSSKPAISSSARIW